MLKAGRKEPKNPVHDGGRYTEAFDGQKVRYVSTRLRRACGSNKKKHHECHFASTGLAAAGTVTPKSATQPLLMLADSS